jgi:hypothetical protein
MIWGKDEVDNVRLELGLPLKQTKAYKQPGKSYVYA